MSDVTLVIQFQEDEKDITITNSSSIAELKEKVKELFDIQDDVSNIQLEYDDAELEDDDNIEDTELEDGETIICTLKSLTLNVKYNGKTFSKGYPLHTSIQEVVNDAARHFGVDASKVNLFNTERNQKLNLDIDLVIAELSSNTPLELKKIDNGDSDSESESESEDEDEVKPNPNQARNEDVQQVRPKQNSRPTPTPEPQQNNMLSVRLNFAYSPPKTIVVDSNESVSQFVQAVRRQPEVARYPMVSITCNLKPVTESNQLVRDSEIAKTPEVYVSEKGTRGGF